MARYNKGDYIKVEFRAEEGTESEWMWLEVDSCDDETQVVFGRLDNVPLLEHKAQLTVGSRLAVSYSSIREHKTASEFNVH